MLTMALTQRLLRWVLLLHVIILTICILSNTPTACVWHRDGNSCCLYTWRSLSSVLDQMLERSTLSNQILFWRPYSCQKSRVLCTWSDDAMWITKTYDKLLAGSQLHRMLSILLCCTLSWLCACRVSEIGCAHRWTCGVWTQSRPRASQ